MTHVLDGDLMRWLDGEAATTEGTNLETHLTGCAACRGRLGLLQRQDAAWRRAVTVLDTPARAPSRRAFRLAWAATILVLLGAGVGVRPLRAWIVAQGRALWATVAGTTPAPDGMVVASAVSRVQFVPAAGPFTITVATPQEDGVLVLERAPGDAASAWLDGAPDDADLVVLPSALRIHNRADATSSYHVALPAGTVDVSVQVGDVTRRVSIPATVPVGRSPGTGSLSGQEEQS